MSVKKDNSISSIKNPRKNIILHRLLVFLFYLCISWWTKESLNRTVAKSKFGRRITATWRKEEAIEKLNHLLKKEKTL